MLTDRHKRKLIDGLVMVMGKPSSSKMPPPTTSDDKEEADEPQAERDTESSDEGIQCAKDAARALGMPALDDDKAEAFATAIREIAGGYKK